MGTMKEFFLECKKVLGTIIHNEKLLNVILAVVVFVGGWIICKFISKCMAALLKKANIDENLNKKVEGTPIKLEAVIAKFVYYILLVYVLLISLDLLGVKGVLDPVENAIMKLFSVVPDAIAALFIGFLGYILAKVVSSIVLAASAGFDPVAKKAGLGKSLSISKTLEKVVFIVIFVPTIISALDILNIKTIADPAKDMLSSLMDAVPAIIGAAIILIVFYIVGRFVVGFLGDLLKDLGADDIPAKIGATGIFGEKSFSKFCTGICFFFIMLSAAIMAVDTINQPTITENLNTLLAFSGNIVIGLIILAIGSFIANFAYERLEKSTKSPILPLIAKVAILCLVITMGLNEMEVGKEIVQYAFIFTFGTIALTIILAFGLGGREPAGKLMGHWLDKLKK